MSAKLDWEKIFASDKLGDREPLNYWFRRIAKKNNMTFNAIRSGWQRFGKEMFPNLTTHPVGMAKEGTKPDFQHFSSDDWQLTDGRTEVKSQHVIGGDRMLALMDIHLPFHDKLALTTAINEGKKRNVDTILLNGDIIDCVSLSRFNKSNFDRSFKDELDYARGFLKWLRSEFPKAEIIYKLGNHEKRFEDYIRRNADALDNIEEIQLHSLLRLATWDITYIEHTQIMKFGKLNIIHGHEYYGGGSINVARGYLLKAFDNILLGHRHTSQDYTFKKVNGDLVGAWSVGCLCKLNPAYMPLNQWNNGFALIEKYSNDNFLVENKTIIEGKIF